MKYIKATGKKGFSTYLNDGKYIYSSYDPFTEAKKYLDSFSNIKKNVITCCGADFINSELIKRGAEEILSLEPVNFDHFENSGKIKRISDIHEFKKYISENKQFDYSLILWQPLIETDPDLFIPFLNSIKEYLKKSIFSKNTENAFSFVESKNFIKNLHDFREIRCISNKNNKINNPAVIISSGYSLHDNIGFLNEIKDHCHFFAMPSSLPFLQHHDIFPDFAFAVDPGYASFYHISKYLKPLNLITTLNINPSIFKLKNVNPLFFNYQSFFENIFFECTDIVSSHAEGTAFMNILRMLYKLGYKDVILVGQDFGFKDDRSHIFEGCFEKELFQSTFFFNNLESKIKLLETSKDIVYINDGHKKIKTETSFSIYFNHFINESFDINIFISDRSFNLLMNKYPAISSSEITGKYIMTNSKDFDFIAIEYLNFESRKNVMLDIFNKMISTKNEIFMINSGIDINNHVHKYFMKKYGDIV